VIGLRAAEGQTINLTCKVFGSPKPHVVWKKGDEQLTGGRYRVMENGNLEIAVSNQSPDYQQNILYIQLSLNYCWTRSTPKIFLDLLEILGFIVSCNLTFNHLIDFITAIVFKPIVNI